MDGHLYAAKPPGMALMGSPAYFLITRIERLFNLDPFTPAHSRTNQYLMTILLSGIPAAAVAGMMCIAFRRAGSSERDAMLLAGTFAFGSLLLPYAGVMMSHSLVTAMLLGAWLLVTSPRRTAG